MPIYEYECSKCQRRFDYLQTMSEPPKTKCEACGGKLERMISPAGFILKGGGWHKDLYASPRPGSSSSDGKGDGAGGNKADKVDKGDRGDQGDKGDKGDRGDKGAKGEKGAKGSKAESSAPAAPKGGKAAGSKAAK
jgi:putative FmdB family regulatory protein